MQKQTKDVHFPVDLSWHFMVLHPWEQRIAVDPKAFVLLDAFTQRYSDEQFVFLSFTIWIQFGNKIIRLLNKTKQVEVELMKTFLSSQRWEGENN
jgi:hypothetical protein